MTPVPCPEQKQTREELILSLEPIARHFSRLYKHLAGYLDWQDLYQEGMIGAIAAVDQWQQDGPASLGQYAGYRIRGAIAHAVRRASHLRARLQVHPTPWPEVLDRRATLDHPPSLGLGDVLALLPPREQRVIVAHYYLGYDLVEIGRAWGVTKYPISVLHRRATKRLALLLDGPAPDDPRVIARVIERYLEAVAAVCRVDRMALRGRARHRQVDEARQLLYLLLVEDAGLSRPQVAIALDRHFTTVTHGLDRARERCLTREGAYVRAAVRATLREEPRDAEGSEPALPSRCG
jgi:RNA polymerase sigma factor (sigma-70 family)